MQKNINIPDIGGATGVEVIEILVKLGDKIQLDTPLVTLESDKASMEIPSSMSGVVNSIAIKLGDRVSEGDLILVLDVDNSSEDIKDSTAEDTSAVEEVQEIVAPSVKEPEVSLPKEELPQVVNNTDVVFAGPSVRRLAYTLGIDLSKIVGSGRKNRISKEDVENFIREKLKNSASTGMSVPSAPVIDFSQFGEIDTKPLNKIKKLTGQYVHRSWVSIPHVTQFDSADITDLEAFRKQEIDRSNDKSLKITILAFVCKAISYALIEFPQFNSSLDATGENLIYKKYCNIGIAVETPQGLVVPVIKNVNQLSVKDIAKEMSRLSLKAREKGLTPSDMSGGCFTISSLGGIGGTSFTPIVNSPEVAILGLSRSSVQPVYINGEFVPRLMLPLSLSYDHRVIDGAEGARFTRYVCDLLSDIRRIIL